MVTMMFIIVTSMPVYESDLVCLSEDLNPRNGVHAHMNVANKFFWYSTFPSIVLDKSLFEWRRTAAPCGLSRWIFSFDDTASPYTGGNAYFSPARTGSPWNHWSQLSDMRS
jgi:hypothetical protein